MTPLELLAPAKNADIGIAAIDCGADAIYIAGPDFGARKAAGNDVSELRRLCDYAHRFGARIFVTFNISVSEGEEREMHRQMLLAQEAGADAFIIRDTRVFGWKDITVPLHASTQCAIRDEKKALFYESLGCSRIILERQLSLATVRKICSAVGCEVEFFVHGALCTGYSGECRLSEYLDGRSADRGDCIQACRSLYDLVDSKGKTVVRDRALLSLKDLNLHDSLEELAGAGVTSFKIEGRLKNISYVRNIVRYYSLALDGMVRNNPEKYCRASFGRVTGGFTPDSRKTFNRDYTRCFIDGTKDGWAAMDAPKSMGEAVGIVLSARRTGKGELEIKVGLKSKETVLHNGDGFAFIDRDGITGFRGDVCTGNTIRCKYIESLRPGTALYRNFDTVFEKAMENSPCRREIWVDVSVRIHDNFILEAGVRSEDGRNFTFTQRLEVPAATNGERAASMIRTQLSKRSAHYLFSVTGLEHEGSLPLLSASTINSIRREITERLEEIPCGRFPLPGAAGEGGRRPSGGLTATGQGSLAIEGEKADTPELMRSKYCIRYELGMCPVHQGGKGNEEMYLLNNGRRLSVRFDCKACEMVISR